MIDLSTRPSDIAVDRGAGELRITWGDGEQSAYPLPWLRTNCPCATCGEERRKAAMDDAASGLGELTLLSGPLPSAEIAGASLVGNYAIQLEWTDGHSTGIYSFSMLRAVVPDENGELPPMLSE